MADKLKIACMILFMLLPVAAAAFVVDGPHNPQNGTTCRSCHGNHPTLGTTGYNNVCLDCHKPGVPHGGVKPFVLSDQSNAFGSYTAARPGILFQTSHNWTGPLTNPKAGAEPPRFATMTAVVTKTGGRLACISCHNQHDNSYTPFLRMSNDADLMCRDCHRSRDRRNQISGTHPVNFNYTGAGSKVTTLPAQYHNPPLNANPANPTSALQLKKGVLLCSTCHGIHYADSSSATFDNNSGYNLLKPSAGMLLRTDLRGSTAASSNICSQCHAGKVAHNGRNQNVQCGDCHGAHVDPGDGTVPNVWLVRRFMNISTSYGYRISNRQVFFQSSSAKNYKDAAGTGVCQGCHDVPVGNGYPPEHSQSNPAVCNGCHFHNNSQSAFSASGSGSCSSCHGFPPQANTVGGPRGYAFGSPFTNESTSAHVTHAGRIPYSKQCIECHQGNSHRSGTYTDLFLNTAGLIAVTGGATPAYDSATLTCSSVYCHSNGAPRGGPLVTVTTPSWSGGRGKIVGTAGECTTCHGDATTLVTNSHGRHLAGSVGCAICHDATVGDNATVKNFDLHVNGIKDVQFRQPGAAWSPAAGSCSALYCHSDVQGQGGAGAPTVFAAPTWGGGPLTCGSCHLDMASNATPTGSHKKHVQTAGIGCTICHNGLGAGSALHADGNVDTSFSGQANLNGAVTGYSKPAHPAGAGYGSCSNTYCHSTVQNITDGTRLPVSYTAPLWGATNVICGSCHANMAVDATGSGSHKLHANVTGNGQYPCATCHNGGGSGTTSHANGRINLSFTAPANTGAVYSLGNSVLPGSGYGSCSQTTCHGQGAPLWGANTGKITCEKCHGSAATVPFGATSGSTATSDTKAGAHTNHLNAGSTLVAHGIAASVSCSECHIVPGSVNAFGHFTTATLVTFGPLAKAGGVNPVFDRTTRSCRNTYCHGATLVGGTTTAPVWNTPFLTGVAAVDCGRCHGYPPLEGAHLPGKTPAQCSGCHPHVNAAGTGFTNISLHINGSVEALGNCDSCHGYPPASRGFTGGFGNWSSARLENYSGGGGMHTVNSHVSRNARPSQGFANCDMCHNAADHAMAPVVFLPSSNIKVRINPKYAFSAAVLPNFTSNRKDGALHVAGRCFNISCHYRPTPNW